MNLRRTSALFVLGSTAALMGGCSSTNDNVPSQSCGADGGTDAATDAPATKGPLSFTPSNIDLSDMDLSKVGDVIISGANCGLIFGESGAWSCVDDSKVAKKIITLPDQSRLAIFVVRSLRVEAATVMVTNEHIPVAIVALDTITMLGSMKVAPGTAGGAFNAQGETKGAGPGGGGSGPGTAKGAGGGGSFCGVGGLGAIEVGGTQYPKAAGYGKAELIPLVGGSAGGSGAVGGGSEGGGGAIQLVAGTSIELLAGAFISAGGGGGSFGGTNAQEASGGGSGGAILLEAPTVKVAGVLAANGGGGGQGFGDAGENGREDAQSAAGGKKTPGNSPGGNGSAADAADGADGQDTATVAAGGGGGGAGRIRINTTSGAAELGSATLSPSSKTTCVSQGTLKK